MNLVVSCSVSERSASASVYCELPPSTNSLYSSGSKRFLTGKGKKHKAEIINALAKELSFADHPWATFHSDFHRLGGFALVDLNLIIPGFYLKSWKYDKLSKTGKGGVLRSPYKQLDSTNYVKLVEDAMKDATGIDDCCTVGHSLAKEPGPDGVAMINMEIDYSIWARDETSHAP